MGFCSPFQKVQKQEPVADCWEGLAGLARGYHGGKMGDTWGQADLSVNLTWPLTGCVALGKSTDLSVLPFPLL